MEAEGGRRGRRGPDTGVGPAFRPGPSGGDVAASSRERRLRTKRDILKNVSWAFVPPVAIETGDVYRRGEGAAVSFMVAMTPSKLGSMGRCALASGDVARVIPVRKLIICAAQPLHSTRRRCMARPKRSRPIEGRDQPARSARTTVA